MHISNKTMHMENLLRKEGTACKNGLALYLIHKKSMNFPQEVKRTSLNR